MGEPRSPAERPPWSYSHGLSSVPQQARRPIQAGLADSLRPAAVPMSDYEPPTIAANQVRLVGKGGTAETSWEVFQAVLHRMFIGQSNQHTDTTIQCTRRRTANPMSKLSGARAQDAPPRSEGGSVGVGRSAPVEGYGKRPYKNTVCKNGFRWLKYGQKLLTNSKLHREYFRCADSSCPAKKHVEVEPATGRLVSERSTAHNHGAVDLNHSAPPSKCTKRSANSRSIVSGNSSKLSNDRILPSDAATVVSQLSEYIASEISSQQQKLLQSQNGAAAEDHLQEANHTEQLVTQDAVKAQ